MFQTKVVEKIKTHILCSITFFFLSFESDAVYEIMWKNIVGTVRPQMTWRMRIACWIPKGPATQNAVCRSGLRSVWPDLKATNTHSHYVILPVFQLHQWLHERTSMLRYIYSYIACLYFRNVSIQP